jgi:hypothetical protein
MLFFVFDADPDSTFHLDTDPDPVLTFNADPDPAPHSSDENLRSPVFRNPLPRPFIARFELHISQLLNIDFEADTDQLPKMTWIFADLDPQHCYRQRFPNLPASSIRSTVSVFTIQTRPLPVSLPVRNMRNLQSIPPVFRIHRFLGLPDPDPFVKGTDPDPFIIKQK